MECRLLLYNLICGSIVRYFCKKLYYNISVIVRRKTKLPNLKFDNGDIRILRFFPFNVTSDLTDNTKWNW